MKNALVVVLLAGLFLAACSTQPATPTEANTQIATPPEAHTESTEQPTDSNLAQSAGTTEIPEETDDTLVLDPLQCYEMIASVHANILMVESWLVQGISDNQRDAMLAPIAEMSISPLGTLFETYTPPPAFSETWQTAQDIHARFYPQLTSWLNGEQDDNSFEEFLMQLKIESNQLISEADQIAFQEFGIDVAEYQPDYSLAMDIVFDLSGVRPGSQAGPHLQTDLLADSEAVENPNLVVSEVTPITYQFAGSDLLLVVGLVENTGSENLELVEVEVSFYDQDNEFLGTLWGTTSAILIEPGHTYPFSASLVIDGDDIAIRKQWATYQITTAAHPLTYTPQVYYQDFDIVLSSVVEVQPGQYLLLGTLTNIGTETVSTEDIFISAAGFNVDGKMAGFGKGASIQSSTLAPGESIPFEVTIQSNGGEPVSYQFTAEVLLVP